MQLVNKKNETLIHAILKVSDDDMKDKVKLQIIDYLIKHGVSVSDFDTDNVTALHLASQNQNKKIVNFLLENGALEKN